VKLGGKCDLSTSIQIAQLALKHRKNKNGGQRIIVFVGAPISETVEALSRLGKQLKKNNVAIDLISVGEISDNEVKLQELINAANTNDNSHLLLVPAGSSVVTTLASSPILHSGAAFTSMSGAGGAGGEDFDMYGGVDPNLDPELAMAIRVSQEEARAQEEARVKAVQEQSGGQVAESSTASASASDAVVTGVVAMSEEDDEEALMQQALEMSMRDFAPPSSSTTTTEPVESTTVAPTPAAETTTTAMEGDEDEDEDEELQRALALSVQEMNNAQTEEDNNDQSNNNNKKRKNGE